MLNLQKIDPEPLLLLVANQIRYHQKRYPNIEAVVIAPDIVSELLHALSLEEAAQKAPDPEGRDRHVSGTHLRLLYLLTEAGCATDSQLWRRWSTFIARNSNPWPLATPAGLRSRRAELVRWGLASHNGTYGRTSAGRRSRNWQATLPAVHPSSVPPFEPSAFAALTALADEAGLDLVMQLFVSDLSNYATGVQTVVLEPDLTAFHAGIEGARS